MIELLTADTPNGKKISIMLEETDIKYKITKINIFKKEQFKPEFRKISPFSKIPVIIDRENNKSIFRVRCDFNLSCREKVESFMIWKIDN